MFDSESLLKVDHFKALLREYNHDVNIYSKHSYDRLDFHIDDSKNLAHLIQNSKFHVDLGSGAGLPGVIIAIGRSCPVICVESKLKKRKFLAAVKNQLQLDNLTIFDGDVQLFAHQHQGAKIESFSAKAFAKPPKLLSYLSLFCKSQFKLDASCWVPVSSNQADFLKNYGEIVQIHNAGVEICHYFRIDMGSYQSYKADLKKKYNL